MRWRRTRADGPRCGGVSVMPNDKNEPAGKQPAREAEPSASDLRKASDDLKARIAEARGRNDMPLDSALGNPNWEKRAADGRFDVPDDDD